MNDEKVRDLLIKHFQKPVDQGKRRHILFWYDKDQSHADFIKNFALNNIKIHILTKTNNFITKKLLQNDDLLNHYLVYAPFSRPPDRDNWLANIIYYSELFTLDDIAIIAGELGIKDPLLKDVIKRYLPFFKNKERFNTFKSLFDYSDISEKNIEHSMMAVLCKEKEATLENIMRSLFIKGFDTENRPWEDIVHFSLRERFFYYVKEEYGFSSDNPTLKKLFISILLAAIKHSFKAGFPITLQTQISGEIKENTCYVFVDHWMKHVDLSKHYNELAQSIKEELKIGDIFENFDDRINTFIECDVFEFFDRLIINHLLTVLLNHNENYTNLREIILTRSTTHWYFKFKNYYEAIKAAIDLFEFKNKYKNGFPRTTAYDMFIAYAKEYFKADQYYRRFYNAYDKADNFDLLIPIRDRVEDIYDSNILQELSKQWSTIVKEELSDNWMILNIRDQKNFYTNNILSILDKRREKVFVIISDALRYEVAGELTDILNREKRLRGEAKLGFMLGCIPSYTKLGMACLLPHKKIELTEDAKIVVNDLPCSDTESRNKILKCAYKNSLAIQWERMKSLPRPEVRELKKHNRIFYIYHNIIDATGDKPASELRTFSSVTKAIDELVGCVRYIVNELSGTNIIITTDHGFLFKRTPLVESDKVELDVQKKIDSNKRFLLTSEDILLKGALDIIDVLI